LEEAFGDGEADSTGSSGNDGDAVRKVDLVRHGGETLLVSL
jgi:hypothetical protein